MGRRREIIDDTFGLTGRVCATCPLREAASVVAGWTINYGTWFGNQGSCPAIHKKCVKLLHFFTFILGHVYVPLLSCYIVVWVCLFVCFLLHLKSLMFYKLLFGNFVCGMSPWIYHEEF